jgi:hypothetical protein
MNFVVGGIIIVVFGRFGNRWKAPIVRRFTDLFPSAMAATVTLGVAPLLFLQLVYPRQVYSSAIVMGWFWLMIIPFVIVSYYFLYGTSFSKRSVGFRTKAYLLVALSGLVYVSLVYSSVFTMAEQPDLTRELYARNQTGLLWNPAAGSYILRWLHMILGAGTVGGFFVGLLGGENQEAFKVGREFFFWGMVGSAIAGMGYLFTLGEHMAEFMRTPAVWALTLGVILSVGSLHFYFKKSYLFAGAMLFVSMVTMVYSRHQVRLLRLGEKFDPASWKVAPQWSPLSMFLICFLIALGLLFYMFRLFFQDRNEGA